MERAKFFHFRIKIFKKNIVIKNLLKTTKIITKFDYIYKLTYGTMMAYYLQVYWVIHPIKKRKINKNHAFFESNLITFDFKKIPLSQINSQISFKI